MEDEGILSLKMTLKKICKFYQIRYILRKLQNGKNMNFSFGPNTLNTANFV